MRAILEGIENPVGGREAFVMLRAFPGGPMRRALFALLLLPAAATAQTDAPPPMPSAEEARTRTTLVDDRAPEPAPEPAPLGSQDAPLPEKILEPPPPEAAPSVSIRTDGRSGDVVEEYRQNGQLYMVKVRPVRGVPYTLLDSNGDGMLDQHDGEGPVRPVYYTLYEWN
jgi:hypothetical protein